MNPLKKVLNKLNGLHYRQEYLCLARESFPNPIHAYLVAGNKVIKDITNHHLFVGYSPLVFTLPYLNEINLSEAESIIISFSQTILTPNEILSEKDALATIHLKKCKLNLSIVIRLTFMKESKRNTGLQNPFGNSFFS